MGADLSLLWGPALRAASRGFVRVPPDVIALMKRVGLTAEEILFVIVLQSFRRDATPAKYPFPGTERLGELLGMDRSTIVRMADRLERRGLLRIVRGEKGRGKSNQYDLTPLLQGLAAPAVPKEPASSPNASEPARDPVTRLPDYAEVEAVTVDALRREYEELEAVIESARRAGDAHRELAALQQQLALEDRLDALGEAVTQ